MSSLVDLWTTKCTRCPAALDKMNDESCHNDDDKLVFVSICLGDRPDDAREIIEQPSIPRWNNLDGHYHMNYEAKETMKKLLNFKSVPFYLVFNEQGERIHSSNKIDYSTLPGRYIPATTYTTSIINNDSYMSTPTKPTQPMFVYDTPTNDVKEQHIESDLADQFASSTKITVRAISPSRVFEIEDLDF